MNKSPLNIPLRRQIRNVGRFAQIINVFARHGYWSVIQRMEMRKVLSAKEIDDVSSESLEATKSEANPTARLEGIPTHLRKSLEELGPAFVKLGQILAVRRLAADRIHR